MVCTGEGCESCYQYVPKSKPKMQYYGQEVYIKQFSAKDRHHKRFAPRSKLVKHKMKHWIYWRDPLRLSAWKLGDSLRATEKQLNKIMKKQSMVVKQG